MKHLSYKIKSQSKSQMKSTVNAQDGLSANGPAMTSRRKLLSVSLGASAAMAVLPNGWYKPVISSVITPAHAQTSVCPIAQVGNVAFGPLSGSTTPAVCRTTFDVLGTDAALPLEIISISDNNANPDVTIDYDSFGTATTTSGPRVVWSGPASDAPFCTDVEPIEDVTFTVTLTCAGVIGGEEFTQDFTLFDILN